MTEHPAEEPAHADRDAQRGLRWAGVIPHEAFDELRDAASAPATPPGAPSPAWQVFFDALGANGGAAADELAARAARVQRRVREDGATYNVHAPEGDASREWPLQLLPFILGANEWAALERGVIQRARLLDATLADVYGPQTLLRDALLPPSLVFAHPQYLRPAHGIVPPGGVHLHVAAFDLARGPEGRWWVLAQRLQAPSGLGYLLENRLIIGREFPEAFAELRVQRVASAFQSFVNALRTLTSAGERARIVLLTPGPWHETYFEQVFLARYLGITLVEGSDLTVRDRQVFLKTMQGLERVHVVLRRIDDEWLDPLELRADSALGVPGLLQSLRAGEVVVANTPGAGVLESPGLAAFWPGVAKRLLGEELSLPASTHWWCGEDSVWQAQRARLAEFVVAPTFPVSSTTQGFEPVVAADLDPLARAALGARVDADPAAFTLQSRVLPSHTPAWESGAIELRPAVLRVFALTDGRGGWRVLPGGMARVAARKQRPQAANGAPPLPERAESGGQLALTRERGLDPWLSMQHGSASADLWVIASGEVDSTTLLGAPLSSADLLEQQRTVTSRAAENLYWLGRYTERSEFVVGLVRLALESLRSASTPVREWLGELAQRHALVPEGTPTPNQSMRVFERALVHALPAAAGSTSVGYNLRALVGCAQALRERLSPDHWQLIQELDDHFEQHVASALALSSREGGAAPVADVVGVLGRTAMHLAAVTGAQTDRMVRDDGWRLLSVGRQVERLNTLCHALARGLELGLHESDEGFVLLLGLFDSVITYRARFQNRREILPMLDLLVFDTDSTRALAWVVRTLRDRLRKLARHDGAWAYEVTETLPTPETWSIDEMAQLDAAGRPRALIAALHRMVDSVFELSDAIGNHLFAHVAGPDRSVWQ
ncbi:MAG: circularly permuted type 2 ATP-grasp protein [Burkholderiaceae bacterium]|nr:circularly permuted type 2 ATP-grasp protein [Burkholderiaceae bacterium]